MRASKEFCKRCNLLTPIAEEHCIHCAHIPDDQIEKAKIELQNTYSSLSRIFVFKIVVTIIILIAALGVFGW